MSLSDKLNTILKLGTGLSSVYVVVSIIYFLLLINIFEPTYWDTVWQMSYEIAIAENPEQMTNPQTNSFWTFEEFRSYIEWTENICLLYTSPSPRDGLLSRMPSSA